MTCGRLGLPAMALLVVAALARSANAAPIHEFCASADDLKNRYHEPAPQYADGNGDKKADDYLMQRIEFKSTVLEEWCINGGSNGGYYIAWKIDGTGKPFKFIGKCSWQAGQNGLVGKLTKINGDLSGPLSIRSTDPKTGKYWEYTYYPELGSIVAQKHDADGKPIPPGSSIYPKEEPFAYNDLPGGSDPTVCVDVTRMPPSKIRRLRELTR